MPEPITYASITGVLITVLIGIGGWVVQGLKAEIAQIRETQTTKGEEGAALRAEVNGMKGQLGRIEEKLDRLLEGRR